MAAANPTAASRQVAASPATAYGEGLRALAQRRIRPVRKNVVSPRGALVSIYLSVIVLIPISALIAQASQGGAWRAITSPQTLAAVQLTVLTSIVVTLINVGVGIATAWVLVRDDFPGRPLLDAAIDLPLALPTIVAGLTLLTLYGADSPVGLNLAYTRVAIGLALLFVSFPFVVRAVQPLLHALDPEVEAAARSMGAGGWTLFRHIHLPQLMPAVLSGAALAFARALGEYGAVVLLSGNIPFQTQVASVYIFGDVEQGNTADAAAVSLVLLLLTLAVLVGADVLRRRYTADASFKSPRWLRGVVLVYVIALIGAPAALVLFKALSAGIGPIWAALSRPEAVRAIQLTLIVTFIAVPCNLVFGVLCALIMVRSRSRFRVVLGPLTSLPLALSPVVIGLAFLLAYGARGWFGPAFNGIGWKVIFDVPGMVLATIFVSLPFVVREVEPVLRELGVEQEEAAATFGANALQTFRHITLPNIAPAVGYGVVLTIARSIGEFGAVSVVSGHLVGRTQTLTQYVADRYMAFDLTGAYVAATLLGALAMLSLFGMHALRRTL